METKEEVIRAIRELHAEDIFSDKVTSIPTENKQNSLLNEAVPYPQDFAPEAYSGIAGKFVKEIQDYTEADPAAILMSFLTACSCYVGKGAYLQIGTEKFTPNIFCLLIGDSAKSRKGTSWTPIREIFLRLDPVFEREHIKGGFGSGEGIIAKIKDDDDGDEENRPDQRLLIYEPEFSSILKVASREGNLLSDIIRKAWDNLPLENNTKLEGTSIRASNPHVAILAHITMAELLKLTKEVDISNGFLNRFLTMCVRRSKLLPLADPVPNCIYNEAVQALKGVKDWLERLDDRRLQFDPITSELWQEIYSTLANVDYGERVNALTARGEPYILRLGLLYAILNKSKIIMPSHLLAAQAIWDRNVQSIRFLFGEDTKEKKIMDAIIEGLRKYGRDRKSVV